MKAGLCSCGKLSWSESQAFSSTSSWPSAALWITSTMFFHLCLQIGSLLEAKQVALGPPFSSLYSRGTNCPSRRLPVPLRGSDYTLSSREVDVLWRHPIQ